MDPFDIMQALSAAMISARKDAGKTLKEEPVTVTIEDVEKLGSEIADMRTELKSKIDEFREMIVSLPVVAIKDYLERQYETPRTVK